MAASTWPRRDCNHTPAQAPPGSFTWRHFYVLKRVVFETRLFPFSTNNIPNQAPDIPLNVLFSLLLIGVPWGHFRNCSQRIDSQQHPAIGKQLITRCRTGHCPHFSDIHVPCSLCLLHTNTPTFFSCKKGAAAPQESRVSASLRSIPPLSLRNGHALDFFHPAF